MIRYYLIRHGAAQERTAAKWTDDSLRPLTKGGKRKLKMIARSLTKLVGGVDHLLSSPAVRAWQTAEILAKEAGWPSPQAVPALGADLPVADYPATLGADGETFALVGHEPGMSRFAARLLDGRESPQIFDLGTGGIAAIEVDQSPGKPGRLLWLATPKMLLR